jgi:predicted transposase/invertase (TIGR01784 family)
MEDENINKAKKVLETISQDERERRLTELREKYRMDQHAIMLAGIEQGIEQGIMQEKQQVAKKLLEMNLPLKQIIEVTGLSKEEIEKITKN